MSQETKCRNLRRSQPTNPKLHAKSAAELQLSFVATFRPTESG